MYNVTSPLDGYYTVLKLSELLHFSKRTTLRLMHHFNWSKIKYRNRWLVHHNPQEPLFQSITLAQKSSLKPVYSNSELAALLGCTVPTIDNNYKTLPVHLINRKKFYFLSDLYKKWRKFTPKPKRSIYYI